MANVFDLASRDDSTLWRVSIVIVAANATAEKRSHTHSLYFGGPSNVLKGSAHENTFTSNCYGGIALGCLRAGRPRRTGDPTNSTSEAGLVYGGRIRREFSGPRHKRWRDSRRWQAAG